MSKRHAFAVVLALMIVGTILRLITLDRGLWYDEILTLVESVRPSLADIMTAYPGYNHSLYSVLAHLSVQLFGEHVWSVRLPAVIFGVLSIPMIYWFGAAITSRLEAALAAALLATSYHHVWFSQNARGYTALLFWTLLSTHLFVKLARDPGRRLAVVYGIVIALGLYTHMTIAFVPVGHAITWTCLVWTRRPAAERAQHVRVGLLAGVVAVVVAGALYLPAARQVYQVFSTIPEPAAAKAGAAHALSDAVSGLRVGLGALGALGGICLAVMGVAAYARQDRVAAGLLLLPALLAVGLLLVTNSPMRPRFFFTYVGFVILIVVRGATEAGRLLGRTSPAPARHATEATVSVCLVAAMVIVSVNSLRYNYAFPKQDFEGARQFIEANRRDSDVVATGGLASYPYSNYYKLPWKALDKADDLESIRAKATRIWLVYAFPEYIDPALLASIERDCAPRRVLHGTLGGGDLTVCAIENRRAHDQ